MPRLSFNLGLLFVAILGMILSASSLLIIKYEDCGFLSIGPSFLCGGDGAGYPLRFIQTTSDFPFIGAAGIEQFSLLFFCINAVLWMIPLLLIFVFTNYGLQPLVRGMPRGLWIVTLLLLAPVWLQFVIVGAMWIGVPTPQSLLFSIRFLTDNIAFLLLGMIHPEQALALAHTFIAITYFILIGFVAAILLIPYIGQHGLRILLYPLGAIAIVAASWAVTHIAAAPSISDIQSYPFRVETIEITSTSHASSDQQLRYKLSFLRLPQEKIVYDINYYASDSTVLDDQHQLGRSNRVDYLKQIDGKIYQMAPGTVLYDQQFVADAAIDDSMDLTPKTQPRYLFVIISEHRETSGPGMASGYPVPIPLSRSE
jgi:hypothetical protein